MSALCQLCGLPMFEGVAGYAGPQCRCLWVRLPKMQDAIEAGDGARALPPKAHHATPFLEMRITELEAYNATRTDELLAATRCIAELEAEVNRLNNIYDEIELRALMSKDSSGNGRTLLERLESNFTELCEERDKAKRRIAELERESAELRKDAERYRWLRDHNEGSRDVYRTFGNKALDAAIDAALAKIKEAS